MRQRILQWVGVGVAIAAATACGRNNPDTGDGGSTSTGSDETTGTSTSTSDPDDKTSSDSADTSGPDTTSTPGPICGDGNVDSGEVCDDGINDGKYGHCAGDCSVMGPSCGDGTQNGPELCDDGADNGAYGQCAADCAGPGAFCGDGKPDAPDEACDDGNDVDGDACSNACVAATCGDGTVQAAAGEACDDGVNDGSYGGCAPGCAALGPACGDGVTDAANEACDDANTDSQDGCLASCIVPHSCLEVLEFDPAAVDGVYGLGVGGETWQAYCDMTTDGGGWTLAAKAGPTSEWAYNNQRWLDASLLAPDQPDLDHAQAKLQTWNLVPFAQILLAMEAPLLDMQPPAPLHLTISLAADSLFALFSPNTFVATTATRAGWTSLVPTASLQQHCDQEGVNNRVSGNNTARVRLGILANNQDDCTSPDSALGVGFLNLSCGNNPLTTTGNLDCNPNMAAVKTPGFAWIFVR